MNRTIERIKLIFLGVFIVLMILIILAQVFYIGPMKRCEAMGNWWAPKYWRCATPVTLEKLTGRRPLPPPVQP